MPQLPQEPYKAAMSGFSNLASGIPVQSALDAVGLLLTRLWARAGVLSGHPRVQEHTRILGHSGANDPLLALQRVLQVHEQRSCPRHAAQR